MLRLLAMFLLIELLAQASGLVYLAQGTPCEDSRSQQGGDEDCDSGCADCLCCPQHRVLVRQAAVATALPVEPLVFQVISELAPTGVPREIMHVPKAFATA